MDVRTLRSIILTFCKASLELGKPFPPRGDGLKHTLTPLEQARILIEIYLIWTKVPSLRLGQLLCCVANTLGCTSGTLAYRYLFFVEQDKLFQDLQTFSTEFGLNVYEKLDVLKDERVVSKMNRYLTEVSVSLASILNGWFRK